MKQRMMLATMSVLIVLAMLITGCAGTAAGGSQTQGGTTPINTISVSGTGDASGDPDVAYVQLGVSATGADVGQATEEVNATMQRIMNAMKELGVAEADMQTTSFNVWPEDKYTNEGQPTGERVFHVDSSLQVKVRNLDQTGTVIEAGLDAGANSIGGLSFGIDDTTSLEATAREEAIANARAKAQELADALGVELGDAIMVSEGYGGSSYPPIIMDRAAAEDGMGAGGAPPISPGQLSISVQVNVVFETHPK